MDLDRLGDPAVVYENFGGETLSRALGYLDRLDDVVVGTQSRTRVTAQARARGTAARPYLVTLEAVGAAGHADLQVETWCSCPVQTQCKHGAALTLALGRLVRRAAPPDPAPGACEPDWRRQLQWVMDGLTPLGHHDDKPGLALRLRLDDRNPRSTTLRLRPMRPGKRGWVQSGVDWHELPATTARSDYDRDHLDALTLLRHSLGNQYWQHGLDRSLSDFGPHLVRLLREAVDAGVTLLPEAPLTAVRLHDQRARATTDVVAVDDGVEVRFGISVDGRQWPVEDLLLLGAPTHTVAVLEGGVVTLAALESALPGGAIDAVRRRSTVRVPAAEAEALPDVLRRLDRLLPVGSSDSSTALPERVAPLLRATVTWGTASSAEVAWTWVYAVDGTERTFPADPDRDTPGGVDPDGLRDRWAERELRARLDDTGPLDLTDRVVSGADTVGLALLEIPSWRDRGDVDVVEVHRPEFRESTDAPEISLEALEPDEGDGPTDWLDLRVTIRVEGEEVPLPHVLEALTLGLEFLVLPSGLYLPTDLPAFARLADAVRAAAHVRDRRSGQAPGADDPDRVRVGRDDLGLLAELSDVGDLAPGPATEWVDRARALRDLVDLPAPEPAGVATELRAYQRDGFRWLAFLWQHRLGGVLADDMGLGKTLQVLALVAHTRAQGERAPFLVVAPTSVTSAWVEQAARHTPGLRVHVVESSRRRRSGSIADLAAGADVVVTSYTLLRLDVEEYVDVGWGGVVLDEAQHVKNHRSQAHQAITRLRTPFALAVTGTPFENRLMELWSLLRIVAPGLYPTQKGFTEDVARPVERRGDQDALRRLTGRIRPFVLRRTKELVAQDLPAKQEQVLEVELGARHRKLYDSHLARERQRILGLLDDLDENRVEILAALTRLRQLSLDPALVDPEHEGVGSAKLDVLVERLGELAAEGHRALVFSTFTGFLARLRERLGPAGLDHTYLDGSTTRRAEVIRAFREGDAPVFLISLKAGGVGLTLTEADYVFVLDPWWNPAAEAQAVDRAHRIGQQRTVMVYRLVSRDTIEDKVVALKERKAALFASVLDGETRLSDRITADDLRGLFE